MSKSAPSFVPTVPCSLLGISCDAKGVEVSAALFELADSREPSFFVSARQDGQGSSTDSALGLVDEVLGNFRRSMPFLPSAAGWPVKNWLSAVVFNAGPGGFTAVRSACALAQGLGFGWNKLVAGMSSLEAWAESVAIERWASIPEGQSEEVLVLLDARMGEVYAGHFQLISRRTGGGRLRLLAEAVLAPELLPQWVQSTRVGLATFEAKLQFGTEGAPSIGHQLACQDPAWYCGDFQASFPALKGQLEALAWRAPEFLDFASARLSSKSLLRLAFAKRELAFLPPSEVAPHYVRNKVALNSIEQQALRLQNRGVLPQTAIPQSSVSQSSLSQSALPQSSVG